MRGKGLGLMNGIGTEQCASTHSSKGKTPWSRS